MIQTARRVRHVLAIVLFILCAVAKAPADGIRFIPPANEGFLYEGRFDFSEPNAPVVIWQASRINLDFAGDSIHLLFDNAKGQNFFNAQVDGSNSIVEIHEGAQPQQTVLSGL